MNVKSSIKWVLFWMAIAISFNGLIYLFIGQEEALQFLGGYVIELSLSMDNLFLFLLIFQAFNIPSHYQRRVLNYGIFGAIVLRLIFVMLGVTVVNKFHWILCIFGGVLLISGINLMLKRENNNDFRGSTVIKILSKVIPITHELRGEKFFIRINKVTYATPLFAILVLIEASDILFAIDSIPAIFSITTNTFIVYTSNIFAILGLRSLYFVLERLHESFQYVKYGVAVILVFTGMKLILLIFSIEINLVLSLVIIFSILALSIVFSMQISARHHKSN